MEPVLEFRNLSYYYHTKDGEILALKDLTFKVMPGEFISIVGPSGCGKSTILSIITELLVSDNGTFYKQDDLVLGYMLQRDNLLEWRTVYENVILGLEIQHKMTKENLENVAFLLEAYGLSAFCNARPSQLSGGMRQRAALIRTLALNPDVLLLDEPFSALDYQTRLEVSDDIGKIIKSQHKTAILVTHDISEAISMGDRIIILSNRPGTVKKELPVQVSLQNRTPLNTRFAPEFKDIFNAVWKELKTNE